MSATHEMTDEAPQRPARSSSTGSLGRDYLRIAKALHYLEANGTEQPGLTEVADHVGLSAYQFQRLFKRWAGVSPKRFLQFLTAQYARSGKDAMLASSSSAPLPANARMMTARVRQPSWNLLATAHRCSVVLAISPQCDRLLRRCSQIPREFL